MHVARMSISKLLNVLIKAIKLTIIAKLRNGEEIFSRIFCPSFVSHVRIPFIACSEMHRPFGRPDGDDQNWFPLATQLLSLQISSASFLGHSVCVRTCRWAGCTRTVRWFALILISLCTRARFEPTLHNCRCTICLYVSARAHAIAFAHRRPYGSINLDWL